MPAFRETWGAIGDSIVVVGGDGLWNCHVHTNDIGAAIEAGIDAGPAAQRSASPTCSSRSKRRRWVARGRASSPSSTSAPSSPSSRPRSSRSASATASRRLLTSLGVQQVVAGGQSMNPSTAQILEAVEACDADAVIVLPNNKNIVPVAQPGRRAHREAGRGRADHGVPEALAALVEYDPERDARRRTQRR